MPSLLRLDLCRSLFGIAPSCPSGRIAGRERFFSGFLDFKFCRVMLDRLTSLVRCCCAHAGNLERQDRLASRTFYIETLAFGGVVGNGVLVRFGSALSIKVPTPGPPQK